MKTNPFTCHPVHYSIIAALVLGMSLSGISRAADEAKVTSADKAFIEKAAHAGLAEVELGKLAEKKAANDHCKSMASQIVSDHNKLNNDLQALATRKGVTIATEPALTAKASLKLLEQSDGEKFDDKFNKKVIADHKDAVELFEKASKESKDADVKAFADNALPTLKKHLETAESKPAATPEKKPQ